MIQIINNKITKYTLPKTGTLSTGETVSGYNLLPIETLKAEGWLPLESVEPEYNPETHYLSVDGYEILEDKVIKTYRIEKIEEPEFEEDIIEDLLNRVATIEKSVVSLEKNKEIMGL